LPLCWRATKLRRTEGDKRGVFDHERLEVYQLALELNHLVAGITPARGAAALRDQLERATSSIVLCIAEGAGRRSPKDKRNFYAMARGSATESAAAMDVLMARRLIRPELRKQARVLLLSIVRMLSRLSAPPPRQPAPEREPEQDP